jgi:crotonobetaine/carnitine-CoA ligase
MKAPLDILNLYTPHDDTLGGAFRSRLAARGSQPFLLQAGEAVTYDQFAAHCTRLAAAFHARGLDKGDRVAVVARNHVGHVLTLFAAARLGAIMVPVNPEFRVEEMRYVLDHAEVSGVIASAETLPTVRQALAGKSPMPWLIQLDGSDEEAPSLQRLLRDAPSVEPPEAAVPGDTCVIVYTSGTTGRPKGVMHGQRSFVAAGEAYVQRMHLQESDRVMIVLPLFHMNALFYSVAGALAAGASAVIVPRFSASTFWQVAADTGATVTNIIEAIGTILQARPRTEYRSDHRIRAVYGVRESFARTFREEFGIPHLFAGFGMTEIPGVTCNPFGGPDKPGSMGVIGRHPDPSRPWATCRILDDERRDVPDGEVGELAVKTPIVMQGYFRDPEQTHAAFHDGWFLTGDLVRRDADGFYFFVSRKKDIIRRRGENIAGAELDRVIAQHPGVLQAAAIAVPSALGEDEIMAVVVRRPGAQVGAGDIALWCRARLAPQKVPRYVCFVDAMPLTPTHKVAKEALRKDRTLVTRAVDLQAATAAATNEETSR